MSFEPSYHQLFTLLSLKLGIQDFYKVNKYIYDGSLLLEVFVPKKTAQILTLRQLIILFQTFEFFQSF
jgi:hypothetical protein